MEHFRHGVAHTIDCLDRNLFALFAECSACLYISGCIASGSGSFLGYKVNQIVYMKHVSAGENTFYTGLQTFINDRT